MKAIILGVKYHIDKEQKENMAKMLNECIPIEDFSGVRSSLENEEN